MTTRQLQFCMATALTMGAGGAAAQAQTATPGAPPPPQAAAAQQAEPQGQEPAGQPYPGPPGAAPTQQYPGGQAYPAQPYPGQAYPAQPYPGQPYSGQPYPGQPYPGQPYSGQPYPGQPYPGQPYPGQPYPGQPYPGQPYPGAPQAFNTTIHIDTNDREATLFRHTGSTAFVGYAYRGAVVGTMDFWQRVCRAPCDQLVDTNDTYSIRGNGMVSSSAFSLSPGQATVNVNAGHTGPHIGGWVLTLLGGSILLGGTGLLAMGALFKSLDSHSASDVSGPGGSGTSSSSSSGLSSPGGAYMAAGGVTMAIGAGALVGGIVLLVKSRTAIQINGEATAQLHLTGGRSLYVNTHGLAF